MKNLAFVAIAALTIGFTSCIDKPAPAEPAPAETVEATTGDSAGVDTTTAQPTETPTEATQTN